MQIFGTGELSECPRAAYLSELFVTGDDIVIVYWNVLGLIEDKHYMWVYLWWPALTLESSTLACTQINDGRCCFYIIINPLECVGYDATCERECVIFMWIAAPILLL